jgi:hypothetical protein
MRQVTLTFTIEDDIALDLEDLAPELLAGGYSDGALLDIADIVSDAESFSVINII